MKSKAEQANGPAVNQHSAKIPDSIRVEVVEEIRIRAYELYEARGRQEGFDQDDWSRAEAEVLARWQKESA